MLLRVGSRAFGHVADEAGPSSVFLRLPREEVALLLRLPFRVAKESAVCGARLY